jgi:voltage-gated potassium channel
MSKGTDSMKKKNWRKRLYEIIYESNTPEGKAFDVALLVMILASIGVVMLDSVPSIHARWGQVFLTLEWVFTILFTIEYLLRLLVIQRPWLYATTFMGIVDLLAILPSYLSIFLAGAQSLLVLRALRLLRIFRIFKLTHFLGEIRFLKTALQGSIKKIIIFMLVVFTSVIILGSIMYLVEKGENGFTSIPDSIYWGIVTITTVGYGDISPVTPMGKFVASVIMLLGYGIIAVPTGIVTTEMAKAVRSKEEKHDACPGCGKEGHDHDAEFCKYCGAKL